MNTSTYITERTNGALSLVDDNPGSTTVLDTNEYFALMFCTEYQSYLRNYIQYKGFSNYNEDLDVYDIDLNKNGFDTGYYVSKDYYNLKRVFKQIREDRGRIIVVSVNDSSSIELIDPEIQFLSDPIATDATNITKTSLNANWNIVNGALGYYLDISTNSSFSTFISGYENKNVSNVLTLNITGLIEGMSYYYRIRAYNNQLTSNNSNIINTTTLIDLVVDYDNNVYTYITIGTQQWMIENLKTMHYADGTPIPNLIISDYDDWFMPSRDELEQMYINLHLFALGGFESNSYPTSSEFSATNIWTFGFHSGTSFSGFDKTFSENFRPCRVFTAVVGEYSLRDSGPAGGLIFYIDGTTYYEAYPSDINIGASPIAWSNIQTLAIGTTGIAIGTGQANTLAIIEQVGHTNSNAKLCNDLSLGGWINDTTGAYCWYDNDIANKTPYGALYSWYAVDNVHGLAPTGWRVPSQIDWNTLQTVIGGRSMGGKLKEMGTYHWNTPNIGATNEYGFTGVGSGYRNLTGVFAYKDKEGHMQSSDAIGSNGYYWTLHYDAPVFQGGNVNKGFGFAVRCMRDI